MSAADIPAAPNKVAPSQPLGRADGRGLAARYRPVRFADLVGQRHVAAVLREAARSQTPPQQVLLAGGSGLGKTTAARIFAAALLCEQPDEGDACGSCSSCRQVTAGTHPDVIEMDAASNGGKDEVNELTARARTVPLQGRWKVYIVDEAHGLTRAGGEAFLKLLEEPPAHVVFVLATTDPEKMLATNRGRCLELELTPPSHEELAAHLVKVAENEGWSLPDTAATAIIARADARLGVRGALMALAKLSGPLGRSEVIDEDMLAQYLAWLPHQRLTTLTTAIASHDARASLELLAELARSYGDDAVRGALISWARESLRIAPEAAQSVWRLETIAASPAGPLWTEALVARLASPSLDGTPAAVAAIVEEAREVLRSLENLTSTVTSNLPAPSSGKGYAPVSTPSSNPSLSPVPVPVPVPGPPPSAVVVNDPTDDEPPYDPAYDEPPTDAPVGASPAKTAAPDRRSKTQDVRAVPDQKAATTESRANISTPTSSVTPGTDPWFDNPDAYDTRVIATAPSATAPPSLSDGDPATAEEVIALVKHHAPASAQLLASCQLVMRDGALYVVVPATLAEAARRSPLRQDIARLAGRLPVHYRVR